MQRLFQGNVFKAYLEINPTKQIVERMLLSLNGKSWIELTEISINNYFLLPTPLGCECVISDISSRQLEVKYEIEFLSSYTRESLFWANCLREVNEI